MNKIIKTIIFLGIGIIIFIGGGLFFKQFYIEENKSSENNFKKISDNQEIIQPYKELFTPTPLRLLDSSPSSFRGNYDILDSKSIIELTNKEREKFNLMPLVENKNLNNSAESKVDDIFSTQYFEHKSLEGIGVAELSLKNGYDYILIGENLAMGNFRNNQDLIDTWMASSGHRSNILKNKYKEIGVSAKIGNFQGKQVWVIVQHFGLSSEVCPEIDSKLQIQINEEKALLASNLINLDALKAKIEAFKDKNSPEYQKEVISYNDQVKIYNEAILELKNKISNYNKQIKLFNTCIEEYEPKLQTPGTF
ncbi:MAG: CAP domain-containing protein [Candidatus Paceibacterota bacterium]